MQFQGKCPPILDPFCCGHIFIVPRLRKTQGTLTNTADTAEGGPLHFGTCDFLAVPLAAPATLPTSWLLVQCITLLRASRAMWNARTRVFVRIV